MNEYLDRKDKLIGTQIKIGDGEDEREKEVLDRGTERDGNVCRDRKLDQGQICKEREREREREIE